MKTENIEQSLNEIRAEWFLALRDQEDIQRIYKQELDALNQRTQQALAPSQARIQECARKEAEFLKPIEATLDPA